MARLTEMEAAFLIKVLENIGLMSLLSNNHAQAFPFFCIICFIYDMYGKKRSSMTIHGSKVESYIMISWQIVPSVIRVVDCV